MKENKAAGEVHEVMGTLQTLQVSKRTMLGYCYRVHVIYFFEKYSVVIIRPDRARAEGGAGGALAPPLFYNKKKNNNKNLSK